jgi:hypothetical protein
MKYSQCVPFSVTLFD